MHLKKGRPRPSESYPVYLSRSILPTPIENETFAGTRACCWSCLYSCIAYGKHIYPEQTVGISWRKTQVFRFFGVGTDSPMIRKQPDQITASYATRYRYTLAAHGQHGRGYW